MSSSHCWHSCRKAGNIRGSSVLLMGSTCTRSSGAGGVAACERAACLATEMSCCMASKLFELLRQQLTSAPWHGVKINGLSSSCKNSMNNVDPTAALCHVVCSRNILLVTCAYWAHHTRSCMLHRMLCMYCSTSMDSSDHNNTPCLACTTRGCVPCSGTCCSITAQSGQGLVRHRSGSATCI